VKMTTLGLQPVPFNNGGGRNITTVRSVMRKPMTVMPEESKPRNIMRADVTIREGFGIEVDGQMKAVFDTKEAAEREARELKTSYPMIQVKVYDASQKTSAVITAETV
jgi:hypothetical protein